jgi:hypothetical protein
MEAVFLCKVKLLEGLYTLRTVVTGLYIKLVLLTDHLDVL